RPAARRRSEISIACSSYCARSSTSSAERSCGVAGSTWIIAPRYPGDSPLVWVYLVACVLCSIGWIVGVLLDWDFLDVLPINLGIAFVVFIVWLVRRKLRARAAADRRGEIATMQGEMKNGFD